VTSVFDGVLVYQAVQQRRVWFHPTCAGRVVSSRVGGEDDSYRPEMQYEYQVAGRKYAGTRRRTLEMGISGDGARAAIQRVVNRYPAGREVTVYDDRDDPNSSWLEAGPDGLDMEYSARLLTRGEPAERIAGEHFRPAGAQAAGAAARDSSAPRCRRRTA
jgi:hypothetical protein